MLRQPVVRDGQWQLLECTPAWEGNWTCDLSRLCLARPGGERLLVAVNYALTRASATSGCRLPTLRRTVAAAGSARHRQYDRDGDELQSRGLYLDVPPWQCHVFEMTGVSALRDGRVLVKWISPFAAVTVFTVMLSFGLLLEREQIVSALRRRMVLAAVLFAVVVPVPALAVSW